MSPIQGVEEQVYGTNVVRVNTLCVLQHSTLLPKQGRSQKVSMASFKDSVSSLPIPFQNKKFCGDTITHSCIW